MSEKEPMDFANEKVKQLLQEMLKLETELFTVRKHLILHKQNKCTHVCLRVDKIRHHLETPSAGYFKVLK